jgi:hypothetical protein
MYKNNNLHIGTLGHRHMHANGLNGDAESRQKTTAQLKLGIWIYFFLLIFEGALRKWFLPGLATPLLVVRDPLAVWLVITCWTKGYFPFNIYVSVMVWVGIIATILTLFIGHGSLPVAIYGARIYLFQFPLIFVIANIFNRDDVIKIGKWTLIICIPVTLIVALQFFSPQTAWVNKGVGGEVEQGFSGAMGFSRPSGVFSFNSGNTLFYSFAACFIFYFLLNMKQFNKLIIIAASLCLLITIPLSISRGLLFSVAITLFFGVFAISRKPQYLAKLIFGILLTLIAFMILSQQSFFQTSTAAFTSRFTSANEQEGGLEGVLMDRVLGGILSGLYKSTDVPFFGYGIGSLTNVGTMLLRGITVGGIIEGEFGRIIQEMGALFGLTIVICRVSLTIGIVKKSYQKLSQGDLLPWMLLSNGLLVILLGGWAQPTSLGFYVILGGLMLASFKKGTDIIKTSKI